MPQPLVFLIELDTLSPQHLPPYGNETYNTPHLNRVAARGDVFHEHYAARLPERNSSSSLSDLISRTEIPCEEYFPEETAFDQMPQSFSTGLHYFHLASAAEWNAENQLDRLERLLEHLQQVNIHEQACWIITAKRGEGLEEHAEAGGTFPVLLKQSLTNQLWIPLIVAHPGQNEYRGRLDLTTPSHLLATMLDWLKIEKPPFARDVSLNEEFSCEPSSEILLEGDEQIGLRTPNRLLVKKEAEANQAEDEFQEEGKYQLFAKPDDRFDMNDLAQVEPELTEQLAEKLERYRNPD